MVGVAGLTVIVAFAPRLLSHWGVEPVGQFAVKETPIEDPLL